MSTVFERAKRALRVATNKELAEKLNQAESSVSGWKSRDAIPIEHLIIISKISGVSIDWILKGNNGSIFPPPEAIPNSYKEDTAYDLVEEPSIAETIDKYIEHKCWENLYKNTDTSSHDLGMILESLSRLEKLTESQNINDLSAFLNVPVKTIDRWLKYGHIPYKYLRKIANKLDTSIDWILFGKTHQSIPKTETIQNHSQENNVTVPLYDTPASAGHGSFFDSENIIQHVPFDTSWLKHEGLHPKNLVCLPIKGDSMSPGLIDGDIVLIDCAHRHGDGVFVLRIGDALRIKRVQWLANGSLRISSDNPLYQPEILNPAELDDTQFALIGACHTKIGRVS